MVRTIPHGPGLPGPRRRASSSAERAPAANQAPVAFTKDVGADPPALVPDVPSPRERSRRCRS
jgi:hypothetical protein